MGIHLNDYESHAEEMEYDDFCESVLRHSPDMTLQEFHALEERNQQYFFQDLDEFMFFVQNRERMMYGNIIDGIRREQAGITPPIPF